MRDKKFTHTTFAGSDEYRIDGKKVDKLTYDAELSKQRYRQKGEMDAQTNRNNNNTTTIRMHGYSATPDRCK